MENSNIERELDWGDEITKDGGSDFVLLPEGDYSFTVEGYERSRHNGSDKLPPCNKAIVKIRVNSNDGPVYLNHNLFLHTKTEGLLSEFFTGIGLKKPGEPIRMNWNHVAGSTGRLRLEVREYRNKDGVTMKVNSIKKIYPKEAATFTAGKF